MLASDDQSQPALMAIGRSTTLPANRRSSVNFTCGVTGRERKAGRRMSMIAEPHAHTAANGVDVDLVVNTSLAKVMASEDVGDGLVGQLHKRASDLADWYIGPAEEHEDHSPATREDASKLQTNGEAMVNLLNNCLGSSLVGISFAIMQAGLGTALICIVFSVLINKYTLLLNLKTCLVGKIDPSGTEIAQEAFSRPGKTVMVFTYTCFGFFCMVSYISASADCLMGLAETLLGSTKSIPGKLTVQAIAWLFLLFPPTLMRSMKSVAILSFVAFVGGLILVASLIVVSTMVILQRGIGDVIGKIEWVPASPSNMLTAGPLLCLAFSIQAGGGVVLATMKDTSEKNINKVTNGAYLTVITMNTLLGSIAYLAFEGKTRGDVIANLPAGNPVSFVARICLLDLVVLSYMIMCIPCKVSLIEFFFRKNEACQEASPKEYYSVVVTLSILALGVATAISDLALINGLNGAVFTNINAFIFPALCAIKINSKPANPDVTPPIEMFSRSNIKYFLILFFGTFMMILGTVQVINEMLNQ